MTVEVISRVGLEFLEFLGEEAKSFLHEDLFHLSSETLRQANTRWLIELVDHYGGEDQGSTYYTIWRVTDKETNESTFLKFHGWYQSHYGTDYTGVSEVAPKTKTVTVYE